VERLVARNHEVKQALAQQMAAAGLSPRSIEQILGIPYESPNGEGNEG